MKVKLRHITLCLATLMSVFICHAKDITLIVAGDGATREEAIQNALLSALEQSYGIFVSADAQVVNDELVKDEIATMRSGVVKKYDVLTEFGDKIKTVSVKAVVGSDKFVDFVRSSGSTSQLPGNTIALNRKIEELNWQSAAKAIEHLYKRLLPLTSNLYDFELGYDTPILMSQMQYCIPLWIKIKPNANAREFVKLIDRLITSIENSLDLSRINEPIAIEQKKVIAEYALKIDELPRLACYAFLITDNIGGKVWLEKRPSCVPPQKYPVYIDLNKRDVRFAADKIWICGITIPDLSAQSKLGEYVRALSVKWSSGAERRRYAEFLVDGLIEIPFDHLRSPLEKWDPPVVNVGKTIGTLRMMLIYTTSQIEKLSSIDLKPMDLTSLEDLLREEEPQEYDDSDDVFLTEDQIREKRKRREKAEALKRR